MSTKKLLNYSNGDLVATGLERPKTTALFFDKLWIPSDYRHSDYGQSLGYDQIPLKICVIEEIEESITLFKHFDIIRETLLGNKKNKLVSDEIEIMPYVGKNRPFYTVEEDVLGLEFLFSGGRNWGLKQAVISFKKNYGIDVVPIFVGRTKFEESIIDFDEDEMKFQLARYEHSTELNSIFQFDLFPIPQLDRWDCISQCNALEASISYVPEIIEESLEWKQVLDVRKDKDSRNKLLRFRNWTNTDLAGKSKSEIIENLENAVDEYKFALKKHGILTTLGGFTTILTSTSTILEAITNDFSGKLSAGFIVTAGIVTYTASQLTEYIQAKRTPVAFIYDILNLKK